MKANSSKENPSLVQMLGFVINSNGNEGKLKILTNFTINSKSQTAVFDYAVVDSETKHLFLLVKTLGENTSWHEMQSLMAQISTVYGYVFVTGSRTNIFNTDWNPVTDELWSFLDGVKHIDFDKGTIDVKKIVSEGVREVVMKKIARYCPNPAYLRFAQITRLNQNTFLLPKIRITTVKKGPLYRYISMSALERILGSGNDFEWALSSICSMNDKWEYCYGMDAGKPVNYRDIGVKDTYIMSLSSVDPEKSLDMWRFYGNQGHGVCLKFQVSGKSIKRVRYLDGYQGYPIFPIYFTVDGTFYQIISRIDPYILYSLKSSLYFSEKESRLIVVDGHTQDSVSKQKGLKVKVGGVKWYTSSDTPFPSLPLTESSTGTEAFPLRLEKIYLGPNSENSNLKMLMLRAKLETHHPNIEVVKVKDMGYLP